MGPLSEYYNYLQQTGQQLPEGTRVVQTPQQPVVTQPQQQQLPPYDGANAIQYFSQIMGPTPAEREAQEKKMLENKRKMIGWTALFDGMRQLGNLYAVSKGATPQQFTDKPYQQIEQNYQQERQLQDNLSRYSQAYAQQLYNLQRQADQDAVSRKVKEAQINWYGTRDEMARLKNENDRLKAEAAARAQDARTENIKAKTKQLEELTPFQKEKFRAASSKYWHDANRPYAGGRSGGSGRGTSRFDAEIFANNWEEDPETFGKILEDAGIGYYDSDTKKIQLIKAPSSNTIRTTNQRYSRQRKGKDQTSGGDKGEEIDNDILGGFSIRKKNK